MLRSSVESKLDELDQAILRILQAEGRISNVELARRIHLSPPATLARVKSLEERGYIRQYTALLDAERLGFDLLCFIHISLQLHQPEQVNSVREAIREMPEVLECHHVTGEYDYLLKVVIAQPQRPGALRAGAAHPDPGHRPHPHQPGADRGQIHHRPAGGMNINTRNLNDGKHPVTNDGPAVRPALLGRAVEDQDGRAAADDRPPGSAKRHWQRPATTPSCCAPRTSTSTC